VKEITPGKKGTESSIVNNQKGTALRKLSISFVEPVKGYVQSTLQMVTGIGCLGTDIQDKGIPIPATPTVEFTGLD